MAWDLGVDQATWAVLALGAAIVGFGKAAVGGAALVAVVLFAMVLPTRESTGILLVVLMIGDLVAIWTYRRHAYWLLLAKLVVPVIIGIAVGAVFLARVPAGWLAPAIGGIVVAMCVMEFVQRLRVIRADRRRGHAAAMTTGQSSADATAQAATPSDRPEFDTTEAVTTEPARNHSGGRGKAFGALAGFTTMVANAGGPVMSLYLLRADLGVIRFVGTFAWFFFVVNLLKLPVSVSLGLVQPSRFPLIVTLIPAILVGAVVGRWLISRIPRPVFEWTILAVAFVTGAYLMVA